MNRYYCLVYDVERISKLDYHN